MGGWYIGRQRVVTERDTLKEVWATDQADAEKKFAAGERERYAYTNENVLEEGPVRDVTYDFNEGAGR